MTQHRVLRLKDAYGYLGMDRHRFNELVRPHVVEVRYGSKSVGFDRLDLDAWWEQYKARNGRRLSAANQEDDETWTPSKEEKCPASVGRTGSGISRNAARKPPEDGSGKARALLREQRQKGG